MPPSFNQNYADSFPEIIFGMWYFFCTSVLKYQDYFKVRVRILFLMQTFFLLPKPYAIVPLCQSFA